MGTIENKMFILCAFGVLILSGSLSFAIDPKAADPKKDTNVAAAPQKAVLNQNSKDYVDDDNGKFPPGSVPAIALQRHDELPKPDVVFPPFDIKASKYQDRQEYSRKMCPIYVKAYEEIYLKKVNLTKNESPFSTFCAKRLGGLMDRYLLTAESFKRSLDRVVVNFETSGHLDAAKERIEKFKEVSDLSASLDSLSARVNTMSGELKALSLKVSSEHADLKNSGGFLTDMGLSKSAAEKTVEVALLLSFILLGIVAFRTFQ